MSKTVKKEDIVVGKDILELLGSAMYAEPLNVYREYVQNAVDSIDEANERALYSNSLTPRIDIIQNIVTRNVTITDNGIGIPQTWFKRKLLSFGASGKRGTEARGFRGVGRLAGLGYCKQLVFTSRYEGQSKVCEMIWDCVKLKKMLLDPEFKLNLFETVEAVTHIENRESTKDDPEHFFQVTMKEVIRHGNDIMLNEEILANYLSQVAPVPFSEDFKFQVSIDGFLSKHSLDKYYYIYLQNSSDHLTRPYKDAALVNDALMSVFHDINFVEIKGINENIAAIGWILHSEYFGAFLKESSIAGIRIRSGNIQVGDEYILADCFPERRFNSWAVGELHIISRKLIPNGRRDDLEYNTHYDSLKTAVKIEASKITKRIRLTSGQRNLIKNAARTRAYTEELLYKNNGGTVHQTVLDVEELLSDLKHQKQKLIQIEEFKDHRNAHNLAYQRELDLLGTCIDELALIPKVDSKKKNQAYDISVKLGDVIETLRTIGVTKEKIERFKQEINQLKIKA